MEPAVGGRSVASHPAPAGNVPIVWMKRRGTDGIELTEERQQFPGARRQRLGEARPLDLPVGDLNGPAPAGEQACGRRAGGAAANDEHVWRH
jgi:hypothetical protein